MKKIIIGSILVIGLATGIAYGHSNHWDGGWGGHMMGPGYTGHMMGPGYGGHMMGRGQGGSYDCPGAAYFGKGGWDSEGHQKFLEDTVGLRKELNDKRFEYNEILRNPSVNKDQVAALEKQIIDIQQQLQDKAQQY